MLPVHIQVLVSLQAQVFPTLAATDRIRAEQYLHHLEVFPGRSVRPHYIHPAWQGRGGARLLYRARHQLARHLGLRGQLTVGMPTGYGALRDQAPAPRTDIARNRSGTSPAPAA